MVLFVEFVCYVEFDGVGYGVWCDRLIEVMVVLCEFIVS